jgi:glycine/D-amino acid oxidase-like deaminating enzyme
VKTWDVIVVGGGIIGLSLSIAFRKRGLRVLVVERGEPGREASHAAAGMLADCTLETPAALQPLASASARLYPEFVHELQDESGMKVDLRDQGTLLFPSPECVSEQPEFFANHSLLLWPNSALAGGLSVSAFFPEEQVSIRALVRCAEGCQTP